MSKTTDEIDGTFAVLVTKYKRASKICIVQDVTSWASVDGWGEFDHALRNEMIEPIPGEYEFGAEVYRPTAKGLGMLEDPQSDGHPSSKVPAAAGMPKGQSTVTSECRS